MNNADQLIKKASLHFLKDQVPKWVLEMEYIAKQRQKTNSPVKKKYRLITKEIQPQSSHQLTQQNDLHQIRRKSEFSHTYGQFSGKYFRIASLYPEVIVYQHQQDDLFTHNRRRGLLGRMKTVIMRHTLNLKNQNQENQNKFISITNPSRRNAKSRLSMPITVELNDIVQQAQLKTRRQSKFVWQISDNQKHSNQQLLIPVDQIRVCENEELNDEDDSISQVEVPVILQETPTEARKPLLYNIMKDRVKQSSKTITQYLSNKPASKESESTLFTKIGKKLLGKKTTFSSGKFGYLTERSSKQTNPSHHSAYSLTCETMRQELRKKQFIIRKQKTMTQGQLKKYFQKEMSQHIQSNQVNELANLLKRIKSQS